MGLAQNVAQSQVAARPKSKLPWPSDKGKYEQAAGFCQDVAYQDAAYLDALVRMFGQALRTTTDLSVSGTIRNRLLERLDRVLDVGHELGYEVGDDMDVLHAEFFPFPKRRASNGNR
jgi:hypothetical protein